MHEEKIVLTILAMLTVFTWGHPLNAQRSTPPPPDTVETGIADLSPTVCPADRIDGPLNADGTTYYGIPARSAAEAFLAPPHDSYERQRSGTQNVAASSLRILADSTDYDACLRLTTLISNGMRSAPPSREWVYFTAGGFYFVARWYPAMALSNWTTGYTQMMVFDAAFNFRGAYAF